MSTAKPAIWTPGDWMDGLVLGAIGVCIIEREFHKAAAFAFAGCILTFCGLMHGEAIGILRSPMVAASYLIVALVLLGCAKKPVATTRPQTMTGPADAHAS
jgi:AGZA family xanthine/uracil permease-like MFS transporter